jgi:hypothetical protein
VKRAEQRDPGETALLHRRARRLHDADERNRRGALQVVEDQMRRVGCQQPDRRTRARDSGDFTDRYSARATISGGNQIEHAAQVDAVDHQSG